MSDEYVNLDGSFYDQSSPIFNSQNRAFRYGDALFETMHSNGNQVQLFDEHMDRLFQGMRLLGFNFGQELNRNFLKLHIEKTIKRNHNYLGGKVRLTIFRKEGGNYTPKTNNCSFLIETEKLPNPKYEINNRGLSIGVYDKVTKPVNELSAFKTSNALIFVLACIYKIENGLDEVLILNNDRKLVEATSSNLFIVRDNQLYTPSLSDGCVAGIMRGVVIELALKMNMIVYDECSLTIADLDLADEIFITNAVNGITWISAYGSRRYYNRVTKVLNLKLNEKLFSY